VIPLEPFPPEAGPSQYGPHKERLVLESIHSSMRAFSSVAGSSMPTVRYSRLLAFGVWGQKCEAVPRRARI